MAIMLAMVYNVYFFKSILKTVSAAKQADNYVLDDFTCNRCWNC